MTLGVLVAGEPLHWDQPFGAAIVIAGVRSPRDDRAAGLAEAHAEVPEAPPITQGRTDGGGLQSAPTEDDGEAVPGAHVIDLRPS